MGREVLGPKALGPQPDTSSPVPAGLLEDERLASAQQAEVFTKQIQQLQGKSLHSDWRSSEYLCLEGLAEAQQTNGAELGTFS